MLSDYVIRWINAVIIGLVLYFMVYIMVFFQEGGTISTDPSYLDNTISSAYVMGIAFLLIIVEAFWFENKNGKNLHQRFMSTENPASSLFVGIFFAPKFAIGLYALSNIIRWHNSLLPALLPKNSRNSPSVLLGLEYSFWIHVIPMTLCMFLGVLQFIPQVRKWKNFSFHRVNGWIIVWASIISMVGATCIVILESFGIRKRLGMKIGSAPFWFLQSSLTLLVLLTSICVAFGAYYAMVKDIPRHSAWMYRLVACWVGGAGARTFFVPSMFLTMPLLGDCAPTSALLASFLVPLLLVEIWIQLSGRFDNKTKNKEEIRADENFRLSQSAEEGKSDGNAPSYKTFE